MNLPALSAIYDRYQSLSRLARDHFSGSLSGKLLLCSGLDADALANLASASIAGACSLCVEPEAERLREALRAGLCDFVVGALDEALRILKNELRRGLPVSVGLAAESAITLAATIERGLQPDLISLPPGEPCRIFINRGAFVVPVQDTPEASTALIEWSLVTGAAQSMPPIAALAAQVLDPERSDTPLRRHWLESAPRHLGRAFATRHCVRMTPAESAAFVTAARAQCPAVHLLRDRVAL